MWTGRVWFVWGGSDGSGTALDDGAVYDPQTMSWRRLPNAPLAARWNAQALWTGADVLVIGGQTGHGESAPPSVAAYHPGTDRWRRLAAVPAAGGAAHTTAITAAFSQGHLYAWRQSATVTHVSASETATYAGLQLLRYEAAANRWTSITTTGGPPVAVEQAIPTGDSVGSVLVPAGQQCPPYASCPAPYNLNGYRWNPTTTQWAALPHGPIDDLSPTPLWTGAALLEFDTTTWESGPDGTHNPGEAAVWDPANNGWTTLPAAPYAADQPAAVWTGDRLVVWGQMYAPADANTGTPTLRSIGLQLSP